MCSADISTNILTLPSSSPGTLTKPTSRRSCQTFISIYPDQPEDWIHSIIATLRSKMPKAHSLLAFGKSDHAAIFLTPEYKQKIVQEPPVEREVTLWSSHPEAMLQASWWRRLGHVPGEFIWRQRIHGGSIELCQHANRTGHWNWKNKDILKSETVGGQNNPWCG